MAMSDGKRLFTDFLRRTVGRVPVLLVWLGAVAGVYTLSDGNWFTSTLSKGYAEARSYAVAPLRGGVLKTLTVELGDAVKRGQIIATLDGAELAAQRARLSAELVQLQARQKAEEDMLESEVTRGEIWVLKTNAQNQADRAELKELETRLTRLNGLAEQHLVTATDIELARRMYAARAAEIATVDQAVKTGRAGFKSPGTPAPTHKSSVAVRLAPYREAIRVQELFEQWPYSG